MLRHFKERFQWLILILLVEFLNATNPTVISSSKTPLTSLNSIEALASPPLTEDNFTSVFPIVCTSDGCIEGRATPGFQIDEYESFFGIPYAEPPVGPLRFAVSKLLSISLIFFKSCVEANFQFCSLGFASHFSSFMSSKIHAK